MGIAFLIAGVLIGDYAWYSFRKALINQDSKKMILFMVIGIVSILLILLSKKFSDIPNFTIVVVILASLLSLLIPRPEREKDNRMKEEKYKGD